MSSHRLIALSLTVALSGMTGCDELEKDPCASNESITGHSLGLIPLLPVAYLNSTRTDIAFVNYELECAEYTLTQPETEWSIQGYAPTYLDLAPSDYALTMSHTDDNGVRYVSDTHTFEHSDSADIEYPLCIDLSGDWSCGADLQPVEIVMDGCEATVTGLTDGDIALTVFGTGVTSDSYIGVISALADELVLVEQSDETYPNELICYR